YTAATGQIVVNDAPIAAAASVMHNEDVPLQVSWNGVWRVTLAHDYGTRLLDVCWIARGELESYVASHQEEPRSESTHPDEAINAVPAPNISEGCLFIVTRVGQDSSTGATPSPLPPQPPLLILYRFGVLLSVGTKGHAVFPHMPGADPYEAA